MLESRIYKRIFTGRVVELIVVIAMSGEILKSAGFMRVCIYVCGVM